MTPSDYMFEVARAYHRAPRFSMRDVAAWHILGEETMAHFDRVVVSIHVIPVTVSEPYPSADAMLADIAQGLIMVSDINHDHPVWTPEVNLAFRVVHDVIGHATTGSGFDWAGELRAWERHESTVESLDARRALFTEAVGQVAWMLHHAYGNGAFGDQKVTTLPQWLQWVDVQALGVAA